MAADKKVRESDSREEGKTKNLKKDGDKNEKRQEVSL